MNEDTIVLGIVGLIAVYLLVNRSSGTGGGGTGIPLQIIPGGPPVVVPVVLHGEKPGWEQVPGGSPGAYRPTGPDSAEPRIGNVTNDETLRQINRMIDSANAVGNWDLSWQLAGKRDAWIKSQGY